ncbi:MAG: TolC family protein [Nitrospirae bacterium]|nr:TolC family protein [Nitrospirota bacterium]
MLLASCFLLLTSLLISVPVFAQETLSLRGLIEEAKNNNPELQALRRNIKAKEAKARAEGVLDDPSFRIEMEDLSRDNPFPSPGNAMQTKYGISQMFPYPGKRSLQKGMALKEVLMAEAEVKVRELEIVTMVKDAYYEYLLLSESIKILKEIKGLLSSMTEIAKIKYATGQASQQDVIKAQVELTMLINEITELEAEREVGQAGLKALLNRSQEAPLQDPSAIPQKKVDIKVEELTEKALEINPALQKMRYEIEANQIGVELARKNYYPDFMVDLAPIQRDGRFDAWDAMFQINIPIWQRKYDSQVTEAQSTVEAGQYKLRAEENIRSAEVKEGVVKVESADRIRTLYETSLLPQVELSFDSALKNYQTGKIDFLTLLDTERILRKTRIDYIGSLVTYYKRIASLEGVVGAEILEE